MRSLLEGGTPRLLIDNERDDIELHAFPLDSDLVRLIVAIGAEGSLREGTKIDVALPRRSLIRSFYEPLVAFWRENTARGRWLHDTSPPDPTKMPYDPDDHMDDFYPVRSARVEKALGM